MSFSKGRTVEPVCSPSDGVYNSNHPLAVLSMVTHSRFLKKQTDRTLGFRLVNTNLRIVEGLVFSVGYLNHDGSGERAAP